MKPTPGPWQIKQREKQYYSSDTGEPSFKIEHADIVGPEENGIAYVYPSNGSSLANARLIVAAPELLLAVQRFLKERADTDDGETFETSIGCIEDMQAAIAKATGGE